LEIDGLKEHDRVLNECIELLNKDLLELRKTVKLIKDKVDSIEKGETNGQKNEKTET
jgi:uncharacterized protein YhaN